MNYNYYDNLVGFNNLNGLNNLFDDEFFNNNEDNKMSNNMKNNDLNLYESLEGYERGNAFKDLYDPYKNYRPQRIRINSEKEEWLTSIGEYSFMAHELNLYLDVNHNNKEALNLFNKYREKTNELILKYERKYGPLSINSQEMMKIPFSWEDGSWPWEV